MHLVLQGRERSGLVIETVVEGNGEGKAFRRDGEGKAFRRDGAT